MVATLGLLLCTNQVPQFQSIDARTEIMGESLVIIQKRNRQRVFL